MRTSACRGQGFPPAYQGEGAANTSGGGKVLIGAAVRLGPLYAIGKRSLFASAIIVGLFCVVLHSAPIQKKTCHGISRRGCKGSTPPIAIERGCQHKWKGRLPCEGICS